MNCNMIKEDYVSFETAKLLKEKGFKEWCSHCYCTDVRHNGESISFDEELDLKDEGRESEIEYIDGGCLDNFGCSNEDYVDENVYAAPTLALAMKWLRNEKSTHIEVNIVFDRCIRDWFFGYGFYITSLKAPDYEKLAECDYDGYRTYEEACEAAIKYCLENFI